MNKLYDFDPSEDLDPYYEIYDCKKMTFMESYLNKPMHNYTKVEIKHPESHLIPRNVAFKQEDSSEIKTRAEKKKKDEIDRAMKPNYFDSEEQVVYRSYFLNGPMVIDTRAEFERLSRKPDVNSDSIYTSFYEFVQPTYSEKDYKTIEELPKYEKSMMKSMKISMYS